MKPLLVAAALLLLANAGVPAAPTSDRTPKSAPIDIDARLREITYDPRVVVTVPVKRGVVTLVVLGPDETITEVAAGLGGDCTKPEAAWCIAAQPGGRTLFVKPKSAASASNNLAVVTDRRTHAFRFVVLADSDIRTPVYRLMVKAPRLPPSPVEPTAAAPLGFAARPMLPAPPSVQEVLADRLQSKPQIRNTGYSLAEGAGSADIVPTLVFDDGRFTYLRLPGNREIPAVFAVLDDGSEAMVNTRMEDDLLVVDRVSRRLMLRAGSAVVGIWNDAFDLEGVPPEQGTTTAGVERILQADHTTRPQPVPPSLSVPPEEASHE